MNKKVKNNNDNARNAIKRHTTNQGSKKIQTKKQYKHSPINSDNENEDNHSKNCQKITKKSKKCPSLEQNSIVREEINAINNDVKVDDAKTSFV